MTQKPPLLLKDYLELDPFSDSSDGCVSFPSNQENSPPTVRYLVEAELSVGARLARSRSRSKNALNKLYVIVNAFKNFPGSSPTRPNIAGKISRIRFWSKKKEGERNYDVVTVKDIVRLDSFEPYGEGRSLCVSSCSSSCSEGGEGSESFFSSSTSTGSLDGEGMKKESSTVEKSPDHQPPSTEKQKIANQGLECQQSHSEEEGHLSPVSIIYFSDEELEEEDDDEITSLCFEQSLANIERTTRQLLQKIRRFENLAELDSLGLEIHLSSDDEEDDECGGVSSSDEITATGLIRRLRSQYHLDPRSEKLLLDFLMDGVSSSVGDTEWLMTTAGNWIDGRGFLKEEERVKDQLEGMERSGRWRFFVDGKDDVAADMQVGVLESLIQELVIDLGVE